MNLGATRNQLLEILTVSQDLVNPVIAGHGKRVARYAVMIAKALGYNSERIANLRIAAQLHDIGAFSLSVNEKSDLNQFDVLAPEKHCAVGFTLLKQYVQFNDIAEVVLHHHAFWNYGKHQYFNGVLIPQESYIIHLADRIDVLLKEEDDALTRKDDIIRFIREKTGAVFNEEVSAAFQMASLDNDFWRQGQDINISAIDSRNDDRILTENELLEFVKILSLTIDYKSRFTSTHSSGVARTAVELAKLAGIQDDTFMLLCGYMHDLGKLLVPNEILDKKGALTPEDRVVVNSHPYYTYHILSQSKQLRKIAEVASKHQEKLDGTGYPFNIKAAEMAMDSRVVAVADIFTALTENRPYRENLDKGKVLDIMAEMSRENHIDNSLFTLVKENYELLDAKRIAEQTYSRAHYETFWQNAEETITQLQQSAA